MTIVCDIQQCGYNVSGFCKKSVVKITQNGACGQIGRRDWNKSATDKENWSIITLVKKEDESKQIEEKGE